jgi:phage gpG-like protein
MRKGYVSSVSREKAVIWNKVSYFPYHQLGTKKIPKRKMFVISPKYQSQIVRIFENYISQITK